MNAMPDPTWPRDVAANAMWAAKYERQVLAELLVELYAKVSSAEMDTKKATDYEFDCRGKRIGMRIRSLKATRGKRDVTIRSRSKCGKRTEVDKLNHVDINVYAVIDDGTDSISWWCAYDVKLMLRANLHTTGREYANDDGTKFVVISVNSLQDCGALLAGERDLGGVKFKFVPSPIWKQGRTHEPLR